MRRDLGEMHPQNPRLEQVFPDQIVVPMHTIATERNNPFPIICDIEQCN